MFCPKKWENEIEFRFTKKYVVPEIGMLSGKKPFENRNYVVETNLKGKRSI